MAASATDIESTLSLLGEYSLVTGAATITDNSAWGSIGVATPDTVKILLRILDPTGDVFYENAGWNTGVYTSPDLQLTDTTYTFTLPTDIAGDYITGQYTVYTKCQVVEGSDTTVVTKTFYQNVVPQCNDITLSVEGQVVAGTTEVKLTDNTNYKTYTALSRVMILYPPPPSGQASQTGTNVDTIVYSGTVYTGVWTWKITSDVTFTDIDGVSTTCRLTGQGTFNVQQSQLCKVLCLVEKYRNQTLLPALGNKNSSILLNNYLLAMTEFQLARDGYICGKSQTVIDAHIAKVYSLLGIDPDCDCGCDDGVSAPLLAVTTVDGTDGTDGSLILYGSGAPASGTGAVGDTYINTANGFVYKKTGASTWTYQLTIIGAAGTNGTNAYSVLYNNFAAQATTTASAWETLDSYEIPIAQISTNGSEVTFVATYTTPSWTTFNQNTRILFNGSTIIDAGVYPGFYTSNCQKVIVIGRIVRVSNTTAKINLTVRYISDAYVQLQVQEQVLVSLASLNFTTTAYTIAAQAYSAVIGDIVSESLEVIYNGSGGVSVSSQIQYTVPFTTTAALQTYTNVIGLAGKEMLRVYLDGELLTSADWSYDNVTDTLTFIISITGASEVAGDYAA